MGTQYATTRTADQWARTLQQTGATMLKTELNNPAASDDPPATFASDAEIEIADQLRRQLEERYLARSETLPPLPARNGR